MIIHYSDLNLSIVCEKCALRCNDQKMVRGKAQVEVVSSHIIKSSTFTARGKTGICLGYRGSLRPSCRLHQIVIKRRKQKIKYGIESTNLLIKRTEICIIKSVHSKKMCKGWIMIIPCRHHGITTSMKQFGLDQ